MSQRDSRLVIIVVLGATFIGLLVGWASGIIGEGGVGWTATTIFIVFSLLILSILLIISINRMYELY